MAVKQHAEGSASGRLRECNNEHHHDHQRGDDGDGGDDGNDDGNIGQQENGHPTCQSVSTQRRAETRTEIRQAQLLCVADYTSPWLAEWLP
jgi:hypothetical protein